MPKLENDAYQSCTWVTWGLHVRDESSLTLAVTAMALTRLIPWGPDGLVMYGVGGTGGGTGHDGAAQGAAW